MISNLQVLGRMSIYIIVLGSSDDSNRAWPQPHHFIADECLAFVSPESDLLVKDIIDQPNEDDPNDPVGVFVGRIGPNNGWWAKDL